MASSVDYKRCQLRSIILSDLEKGRFRVGDQLPTENEMVQQYGMSRATVREAIALLVQEGVLARKRGAGTFIQSHKPRKQSNLIAAMVPCHSGQLNNFGLVIREIENRVHDKGYSLIVCNHEGSKEKAERYLQRVAHEGVAGVIFSPIQLTGYKEINLNIVRQLEDHGIPFVLIASPISGDTLCRYSFVSSNGFVATREIVRHLVGLGHRRIAYIRGFSEVFAADERYAGFMEEMRRQELTVPEEYVRQIKVGDVNLQGRHEVREILAGQPAPTAVICVHDMVARNVIEEAGKIGLKVPDDLAVVGFDDAYFAATLNPPLTTVRTPLAEEAAMDVEILLAKIDGTLKAERQEFLAPTLVVRASCGAALREKANPIRGEMKLEGKVVV